MVILGVLLRETLLSDDIKTAHYNIIHSAIQELTYSQRCKGIVLRKTHSLEIIISWYVFVLSHIFMCYILCLCL